MEITTLVSRDYIELPPDTRASKLVGTFSDPGVKGVIVRGDEFKGVVTRRQLATSHRKPNEKIGSLVWPVPRLSRNEDVRKVAELMIESDSRILPVFEGRDMVGVVTVDDILEEVQPYLDAATVQDAYSSDLVTVSPNSTIGKAINSFREYRITHLPVVTDTEPVGLLSLYDITDLTVRSMTQSQGGDPGGVDSFGGEISDSTARTHKDGYGARDGEVGRILDLPVRDLMATPVRTIEPGASLEAAVEQMFSFDGSSLLVTENGPPYGILTKTDVLDSLTWETGGNRAVQVYGIDLVDDANYDDIVAMIDNFDAKDQGMSVLDAKIHLQKHDERLRGTPLLLVRVRLHTDRGLFIASGEGYGASHALNEVREKLERQIRDRKTRGRSKKPPGEEFWKKRFGWLLE